VPPTSERTSTQVVENPVRRARREVDSAPGWGTFDSPTNGGGDSAIGQDTLVYDEVAKEAVQDMLGKRPPSGGDPESLKRDEEIGKTALEYAAQIRAAFNAYCNALASSDTPTIQVSFDSFAQRLSIELHRLQQSGPDRPIAIRVVRSDGKPIVRMRFVDSQSA
jgi:hypothetical protein